MATLKLATPICLASPAFFTLHSAAIDSASGTCALGQWIINRSTHGSASRSRLSSTERSKSPAARRVNQTLVVRKISSPFTPEASIPGPTPPLVPLLCRGVDRPMAEPQRLRDQLHAQILLQRHSAEAEDRNARAVTFNDVHAGNNLHENPPNAAGGPQHRRLPPPIPAR